MNHIASATTQEALALLNAVLPPAAPDPDRRLRQRLEGMGVFMPVTLGVGTVTKGCPHCGGTMISNYETDENGNIINQGPYICTSCGGMG